MTVSQPEETNRQVIKRIRKKLTSKLDADKNIEENRAAIRERILSAFGEIVAEENLILTKSERERLFEMIVADPPRNPVETLLIDTRVQQIAVMGSKHIMFRFHDSDVFEPLLTPTFDDEEEFTDFIQRFTNSLDIRLDDDNPSAQCVAPDGSYIRVLMDTFGTGRHVLIIDKALTKREIKPPTLLGRPGNAD